MAAALENPDAFAAVYGAQLDAMAFPPTLHHALRTKLRSEARQPSSSPP